MGQHAIDRGEGLQDLFQTLAVEFGPVLVDAGKQFLNDTLHGAADQGATSHDHAQSQSHLEPHSHPESQAEPEPPSRSQRESGSRSRGAQPSGSRGQSPRLQNEGGARPPQDGGHHRSNGSVNGSTTRSGQHRVTVVMTRADIVGVFTTIVEQAGEVRKLEEAQKTERADIAARRDVAIANIEAQKEALQAYLDKSFDERRENFRKLFSVVDHALETNNMQELAMSLQGILTLADTSPFKDLQTVEATAAALSNPDHEWDF